MQVPKSWTVSITEQSLYSYNHRGMGERHTPDRAPNEQALHKMSSLPGTLGGRFLIKLLIIEV